MHKVRMIQSELSHNCDRELILSENQQTKIQTPLSQLPFSHQIRTHKQ